MAVRPEASAPVIDFVQARETAVVLRVPHLYARGLDLWLAAAACLTAYETRPSVLSLARYRDVQDRADAVGLRLEQLLGMAARQARAEEELEELGRRALRR